MRQRLDEIAAIQTQWQEEVPPPAPVAAIEEAEQYLRGTFGCPLPPALARLWSMRDGVDFNGMLLYRASETPTTHYRPNLQEMNEAYAEVTGRRYLFIGEADMDAFVHDQEAGGWHMADRISLDSSERFESCEALILAVLDKYLRM